MTILPGPHLTLPETVHQKEEQGQRERGSDATGHQSNAKISAAIAKLIIQADDLAAIVATAHGLKGFALAERLAEHHLACLGQATVTDAQAARVRSGHIMHARLIQLAIVVPAMAALYKTGAHRVAI